MRVLGGGQQMLKDTVCSTQLGLSFSKFYAASVLLITLNSSFANAAGARSSENPKPEPSESRRLESPPQGIQRPASNWVPIPQGRPTQSLTPGSEQNFAWVGKWYSGSEVSQCRDDDSSDALLVFTAKTFNGGRELFCKITKITPLGNASELRQQCSGEGESFKSREIVEVVNGKLRRTFLNAGRQQTYTYSRCPTSLAAISVPEVSGTRPSVSPPIKTTVWPEVPTMPKNPLPSTAPDRVPSLPNKVVQVPKNDLAPVRSPQAESKIAKEAPKPGPSRPASAEMPFTKAADIETRPQTVIWPLGPRLSVSDRAWAPAIEKIQANPGKKDVLGVSLGMTYREALSVLAGMKDISRADSKCEALAFPPATITEFQRRGDNLSCRTADGRIEITFTKNSIERWVSSVALDFPSGATPVQMVENVTSRFGGNPQDQLCKEHKDQAAYEHCLKLNQNKKNNIVIWDLGGSLVASLKRQERLYDRTSNAGFILQIESRELQLLDRRANDVNIRLLNSQPEITESRNDLIGIRPGMRHDQIPQSITARGYYLRQPSQDLLMDEQGLPRPYCTYYNPSKFNCMQASGNLFEIELGLTTTIQPRVITSVQLVFGSGLDEMPAYVAERYGALPTTVSGSGTTYQASWALPNNLVLKAKRLEQRKWLMSVTDMGVISADKQAFENVQQSRNVQPRF